MLVIKKRMRTPPLVSLWCILDQDKHYTWIAFATISWNASIYIWKTHIYGRRESYPTLKQWHGIS
jgi:hypothetical protein